jgi:DNA-binding response OmpR family regulator
MRGGGDCVSEGRILLIEDEPTLVRGVRDTLTARGFEVESAHDGQSGLDAALRGQSDLILLDVMLPKLNGYEVCRLVRAHGIDVPILMLTAKGEERDVVLGLNVGADDYIVKPFRAAELVARAKAFLRRRKAGAVNRFGDCEIDMRSRTATRRGRPLDLTTREFGLLAYFAANPGRALSRDVILNSVWGRSVFVTPRSVDRCIATLRAKVEADPHNPVFIQTIREIGYRFEPSGRGAIADS